MKSMPESTTDTIRPEAKLSDDEITRQALMIEFDQTLSEEEKNRRFRLLAAGLKPEDVSPPTRPVRITDEAEARRIVALGLGIDEADLMPAPINKTFWHSLQFMVAGWLRKKS